MAPQMTGQESSGSARRRLIFGFTEAETLPLALALQGFLVFALAFVLSAPSSMEDAAIGAHASADAQPVRKVLEARLPADLLPERIRLPRLPDTDPRQPEERVPEPGRSEQQQPSRSDLGLAALRVESVAFNAPAAVKVALALPGAPDRISPGTVSMARFDGEAYRGAGRRGREGGWSGIDVEGLVGRTGGSCGRGPQPRPPHIVERPMSLPFN
jgi:hypothetical protein